MSPGFVVTKEYVFKRDAAKIRTHMSCQAALLLLFTITSTLQGEETTTAIQLRCDLIVILVNAAATTLSEHPLSTPEQPPMIPPALSKYIPPLFLSHKLLCFHQRQFRQCHQHQQVHQPQFLQHH